MKIETLQNRLRNVRDKIEKRITLLKKFKQKGAPLKGTFISGLPVDTRDAFLACSSLEFASALDNFYGLLEKICVLVRKRGGKVPEKDENGIPLKIIEKIVAIGIMTPEEGAEWIELKNLRNNLIHDYDEKTALVVLGKIERLGEKFEEFTEGFKI